MSPCYLMWYLPWCLWCGLLVQWLSKSNISSMLGLCVEVRDLCNSVRSKPYPGTLGLGSDAKPTGCQSILPLPQALAGSVHQWWAPEAARCSHLIRSSCTASEASLDHQTHQPFPAGAVTDEPSCPTLCAGTKFSGFQTKAMAAFVLFFFFPVIFSLCPNWVKAAVSKNMKLSHQSDSGTFEKSYPEIDALVYTGSIRRGWLESLLCEIVGGIKCEQWEESWWSTPHSDALVGNQALLIMDVLEWAKAAFISPVTVALQEDNFPWEGPCCEQCQHIVLAQRWWRLGWHWWSQECGCEGHLVPLGSSGAFMATKESLKTSNKAHPKV